MHRSLQGDTLLTWEKNRLLWEADYEIYNILLANLGPTHQWITTMHPRFQHTTHSGYALE